MRPALRLSVAGVIRQRLTFRADVVVQQARNINVRRPLCRLNKLPLNSNEYYPSSRKSNGWGPADDRPARAMQDPRKARFGGRQEDGGKTGAICSSAISGIAVDISGCQAEESLSTRSRRRQCQWHDPRPPGPADYLRTWDPPRSSRGAGRQYHRSRHSYRGQRLNRPNDVVVRSDGSIYFTDPKLGTSELDYAGVYRVAPDLGSINLLARDFVLPNGLLLSPDEKTLYINDTLKMHIRAFEIDSSWNPGLVRLETDRVFCTMSGNLPGHPDGMKVDLEGNVYCTGPGGIWIMNSSGKHLGTILVGTQYADTTNLCFGGEDWTSLFFTTRSAVGRVQLKTPGVPVPRGKK